MSKNLSFPCVTLVLGGARSGKSQYAENLFKSFENPIYLATAEDQHEDDKDGEMAARIAKHKLRRGSHWQTIEEPIDIISILKDHSNVPVLVDCMTLWLANIMSKGLKVDEELKSLAEFLRTVNGPLVLVTNEVGQGITPNSSLARSYIDSAGLMNQKLAICSEQVVFVRAGIPQILKEG